MTTYLCSLEGAVLNDQYESLIEFLDSICISGSIPYKLREVSVQKEGENKSQDELRVRYIDSHQDEPFWLVRKLRPIRLDGDLPTTCQLIQEHPATQGIETFLLKIGYKYVFEYLEEGVRFVLQAVNLTADIRVAKIKSINVKGSFSDTTDVVDEAYYVRLECFADEKTITTNSHELSRLSKSLVPFVELKKQ